MSEAGVEPGPPPRAFEPGVLTLNVLLSVVGAIIGLQTHTTLGVTPNTALIGVLVAIAVSRLPLGALRKFRSVHRQNLVQSTISSATFGAANSLLLPMGIPALLGRPDLMIPMLVGATMGMLIDLLMLYWLFDSRIFPGRNAWPPGVAAAETIRAADRGGKRALFLVAVTVLGVLGSWVPVPAAVLGLAGAPMTLSMSAFGTAFIGNAAALALFGLGVLGRAYADPLFGVDLNALYIPHGVMIGAGLVALVQVFVLLARRRRPADGGPDAAPYTRSDDEVRRGILGGTGLYLGAAILLAVVSGLVSEMSLGLMAVWVVFAAFSCIAAEFIVGLSAMHAGWFPAFATALIFLLLGMVLGFPAPALAVLVGFVASGGPAFADAGYDLKAGWVLRGGGADPVSERYGRRQQILAGMCGLGVGWAMVALFHNVYFSRGLFPPVDRVFAATITAGVDPGVLLNLLVWAVPGAIIQAVGGPGRQMGILLATGLLILNPLAGWAILAGVALRLAVLRRKGREAETPMTIMAAGFIAGDALWGFGSSVVNARRLL